MNILLIGHRGYLGKGLLEYFRRNNHRVVGWDLEENLFHLNATVLRREKIDLLVNLAVVADLKSKTFEQGSASDKINVQGARHLVDILKGTSIPWIQFSTREVLSSVYTLNDVTVTPQGYFPKMYIDDTQPYAPQNCYGKSKVIAEFISESHPFSNVIRLTSPYTDYFHSNGGWVLQLTKRIVQEKAVTLTGAGKQFRDPLHTDDLGHLIELIVEKGVAGEKIHAGGGSENIITLREFVMGIDPHTKITDAAGGDYGIAFSNEKATRLTGWTPQVLIREKCATIRANVEKSFSPDQTGLGD